MHKQHSRRSVGRRTTPLREPRVFDLTAERERREACNRPFLMIADGLPCGRPHPTFDNVASEARQLEGRGDPSSYIMRPMLACVDAAVGIGNAGMLRALFDRIDVFFAVCRRVLMARVPEPMRSQAFGADCLMTAYMDETMAEKDGDIAQALAVARPNDPRAVEAARDATAKVIERGRAFVTACDLTLSRGSHARGVLVTR